MLDTWEKIIDPNFINAELIGEVGAERTVTIKNIDYLPVRDSRTGKEEDKICCEFEECKPMVLNKTNRKKLRSLFQCEPNALVGEKITLYVEALTVAGRATTGIRIKEYSTIKCEECGNPIEGFSGHSAEEIASIGKKQFGKAVCTKCANKLKKEKENSND